MATRAAYCFKDKDNTFYVYKHWDGYPSNVSESIQLALPHAFTLPRFEADEFAAAFIRGNKFGEGGIRLMAHWSCIGDIEYRYEIYMKKKELYINAWEWEEVEGYFEPIFSGKLKDFGEKFNEKG